MLSREQTSGAFDLSRLRDGLKPFRLHWHPRLRSTSDHAAALRGAGNLFAPALVLTGHQLAGRGRGGNTWWSSEGGVTVTYCLPIDPTLPPHYIPLLAGIAVRRVAERISESDNVQLKWPNDLLAGGKKLAGLLCERVHRVDLIGVGVNVNTDLAAAPAAIRKKVTSIKSLLGRPVDRTEVVIAVGRELLGLLVRREEGNFATLLREYDRHHALIGRQVRVSDQGSTVQGLCEGLDREGRLLLRNEGGVTPVLAGHVEIA